MKRDGAFHPDKLLSLAHRNAIAGARPEDLSYHRKASRAAVAEDWTEVTDLKKLKSKIRQVYYLNNPFKGNDSVLAHAIWSEECRGFYQEQMGKLLHFPSFPDALAVQPAIEIWPEKRIAELRVKVKKARAGVKIAEKLGKSGSWLSALFGCYAGFTVESQAKWMPKIEAALNDLLPITEPKGVFTNPEAIKYHADKATAERTKQPERTLVSFPFVAPSLISGMMVDIKDGRLQVTLEVDVREAVKLYAQQNRINTEQKALVR